MCNLIKIELEPKALEMESIRTTPGEALRPRYDAASALGRARAQQNANALNK